MLWSSFLCRGFSLDFITTSSNIAPGDAYLRNSTLKPKENGKSSQSCIKNINHLLRINKKRTHGKITTPFPSIFYRHIYTVTTHIAGGRQNNINNKKTIIRIIIIPRYTLHCRVVQGLYKDFPSYCRLFFMLHKK